MVALYQMLKSKISNHGKFLDSFVNVESSCKDTRYTAHVEDLQWQH